MAKMSVKDAQIKTLTNEDPRNAEERTTINL